MDLGKCTKCEAELKPPYYEPCDYSGKALCADCWEELDGEVAVNDYYETGGCADCDRGYGPGTPCRCNEEEKFDDEEDEEEEEVFTGDED